MPSGTSNAAVPGKRLTRQIQPRGTNNKRDICCNGHGNRRARALLGQRLSRPVTEVYAFCQAVRSPAHRLD
eukprot:15439368-Alexandrium_andersonii.AAC.1